MIRRLTLMLAAAVCLGLTARKPLRGADAPPGLWTQATTVATFRGKWLDARQYQKLQASSEPQFCGSWPRFGVLIGAHWKSVQREGMNMARLLNRQSLPGESCGLYRKCRRLVDIAR
jgi:hypothetical protein